MNQNIEVINEHLWAVNYHHLNYINDLSYHGESADKVASISNDGIIILNKNHEMYPTLKQFFPKIMQSTDEELQGKMQYMKGKNRDGYDRAYKFCLDTEAKRRLVERQFNQQPKGSSTFQRILNFIRFNSKERG